MDKAHTPRLSGEDGANLVEYAMLISLVFLVALAAITFFADSSTSKFTESSDAIQDAGS